MAFLNLEHSARAYYADLVFYGAASMGLSLWLAWALPTGQRLGAALLFALGVLIWTLLEYLLHRFVLHGFDPFRRWHQMHHDRPAARICSPTVISASAFGLLVLLPSLALLPTWQGLPLAAGVLAGLFVYSLAHHALHHHRPQRPWARRYKLWHASHHQPGQHHRFGVTTFFWDGVWGTTGPSTSPSTLSPRPAAATDRGAPGSTSKPSHQGPSP